LELLKITGSTLWRYQNQGRIKVYKFSNKAYFKRSELMNDLILLKK
jgi:predicted site-specific integrase-resolvase